MNSTSNATLSTGLTGAWFCSVFALAAGALWLQVGTGGRASSFYDSHMLGYLLVLTGLLSVAPLTFATAAAWFGHTEIARRTSRVIKCAAPTSIFLGWVLSKTLEWLSYSGLI